MKEDVIWHEQEFNSLNFKCFEDNWSDHLHLAQFYKNSGLNVKLSITVDSHLVPSVYVHGKALPSNHNVLSHIMCIYTFSEQLLLAKSISEHYICVGNLDSQFVSHFGFKGKVYMEKDCGARYSATIRAQSCQFLTLGVWCSACSAHRSVLRAKEKRIRNQKTCPHSSMSKTEIVDEQKLLKNKNQRLRERLQKELDKQAVAMNKADSAEVHDLVKECTPHVEEHFEEGCFQRIFWEELLKFHKLHTKSSMHWHPLIVKWALLTKSKSSKAYEAMKDSGFINLPSERTLYDYSHCMPSKLGFTPEAVNMLVKQCHGKGMFKESWGSYVGLLQDEMKVKSDLVYCPTSGRLIGYVELDDVNNQLLSLQNNMDKKQSEPGGGGHSNGKRGYQAHPWTHKKHPNHIFFRYEKRP